MHAAPVDEPFDLRAWRASHAHSRRACALSGSPQDAQERLHSEDYVRRAKAFKLNLSELLERALEVAIREAEREIWLKENEAAIAQYNEQVARRGVFSQGRRRF